MPAACVFIAGHGKMVCGPKDQTVDPNFSIGWAVPEKTASQPSISRTMIAGQHRLLSDIANAGEKYNEHYLIPDGAENMIRKARDLRSALNRVAGFEGFLMADSPASYWLLQPKGERATKLSSILKFLRKEIGLGVHIDVLWTCCRSPIGHAGLLKADINPDRTSYLISTREKASIVTDPTPLYHDADGAVTLIQATDAGLGHVATWQGTASDIAPGGILGKGQGTFITTRPLPQSTAW